MTTIIENVCSAIRTVASSAPGITTAYDPPPGSIPSADLPALYVFTGGGTHSESSLGPNVMLVKRVYRVQVAVLPIGQGKPSTRETSIRPLLDNTIAHFRKHPTLGKTARVRAARVASDSGIVILPEWSGIYIGFEIRLEVATIEPRDFSPGE